MSPASSTKAAAPSPLTMPSRWASKGRQAAAGSSARPRELAGLLADPDHGVEPRTGPAGDHHVDLPAPDRPGPPRPPRPGSKPRPARCELVGPRTSWAMPMWQAGMLGRYLSIQRGKMSPIAFGPQRRKSNLPSTMQPDRWGSGRPARRRSCRRPAPRRARSGSTGVVAQAGVGAGQVGRGEAELDVAAHDLQALARTDILLGIEVGHRGADRGRAARPRRRAARSARRCGLPRRRLPEGSRPMPIGLTTPTPVITTSALECHRPTIAPKGPRRNSLT